MQMFRQTLSLKSILPPLWQGTLEGTNLFPSVSKLFLFIIDPLSEMTQTQSVTPENVSIPYNEEWIHSQVRYFVSFWMATCSGEILCQFVNGYIRRWYTLSICEWIDAQVRHFVNLWISTFAGETLFQCVNGYIFRWDTLSIFECIHSQVSHFVNLWMDTFAGETLCQFVNRYILMWDTLSICEWIHSHVRHY